MALEVDSEEDILSDFTKDKDVDIRPSSDLNCTRSLSENATKVKKQNKKTNKIQNIKTHTFPGFSIRQFKTLTCFSSTSSSWARSRQQTRGSDYAPTPTPKSACVLPVSPETVLLQTAAQVGGTAHAPANTN